MPTRRRVVSVFDLVIVGAGPAGLAAAQGFASSRYSVALVDGGKPVRARDRYAPSDMTRGHGGAGLFSDGKFSFFPSATELWMLPGTRELHGAYSWT